MGGAKNTVELRFVAGGTCCSIRMFLFLFLFSLFFRS
jgi:hypothetical protein